MAEDNSNLGGPGLSPSGSTKMTLLGGAIATVTMAVLNQFGIHFDAGFESALATLFAAACGYFPSSGRK